MTRISFEIIRTKGSVKWVIKATVNGESRYRGYHYKRDAVANLPEWVEMSPDWFYPRNFYHNFDTAEDLGIALKEERDESYL